MPPLCFVKQRNAQVDTESFETVRKASGQVTLRVVLVCAHFTDPRADLQPEADRSPVSCKHAVVLVDLLVPESGRLVPAVCSTDGTRVRIVLCTPSRISESAQCG